MKQKVKKQDLYSSLPIIFTSVLLFVLLAINLFPGFLPSQQIYTEQYQLISLDSSFNDLQVNYSLQNINNQLKSAFNPINGIPITQAKRDELDNKKAYVVTVNNHYKARPQHGLSQADMVMEVLAEGGITRYVAVFYGEEPEKIGPVRSIRRYMVDFIAEFDSPVILHEGGASFNDHDDVYVRETDAIRDIFQYGMKSNQTAESRYRDLQKSAQSGYVHSLYTGYDLIDKDFDNIASRRGWERESNIEELNWKYDDVFEERGDGGKLDISFLEDTSFSNSGFEYDKETNSYKRTITNNADIDLLNDQQISPKNVIVEWHKYRLANDGYSRIILDMIGEGDVTIYRDGKEIIGKWVKPDRESRTRYYDENDQEIDLVRGQVWKTIAVTYGTQKFSTVNYQTY